MLVQGLESRQSSIRSKVSSADNFLTSYYPIAVSFDSEIFVYNIQFVWINTQFLRIYSWEITNRFNFFSGCVFLRKKIDAYLHPNKPNRYLYFRPITAKNTFGISVVLTRRYILFEKLARNLLYNHVGTLLLIRLSCIENNLVCLFEVNLFFVWIAN